jgi:nucleoside-diphosphate-sugar epimerase
LVDSQEVNGRAICAELGWRPPFTLEQGLLATAEWYRAQRG